MADILWQNDDGGLQVWFMGGNRIKNRIGLVDENGDNILIAPPWRIVATGDFDSDGRPDILWQADDGGLQIWFMDGHRIRNRIGLVDENGDNILIAPPWRIVATGDFDSDGRPDILWQADDGGLQIWFMDGHRIRNRIGLVDENGDNILIAPPWRIVATGDFDSDGRPDILWQADDGGLQIWFMDGHRIRNRIGLVDENGDNILIAPPWRIVATGDFDSDGRPDILWQADDGGLQIWFMDGHRIRNRIGLVDENGDNILIAPPWRIVATLGVELAQARKLIDDRYKAAGGITGPLGLPLGTVRPTADGAVRPFAGGPIRVLNHGGVHGPGPTWCVMVRFLGFHCIEESNEASASEEPYFLISVVGANKAVTRKVGPVENVDAGEDHTIVSGVAAFEDGIVPPIILGVIANENDEGSPEEAAAKARQTAEAVVGKFEEAMATFGAATTSSHVMPEWFRDILVGWIPEGVAAVFGLGDDHIGSNGKILFDYDPEGMDWRSPPALGTFGVNPYNVKLPVGVNPEEGRYELYFDVKVAKNPGIPVL